MTAIRPVRLGICGLGRAFTLMLPTFLRDDRVELVAAYNPSEPARRQFERDFGGTAHDTVEALCADPAVDAVYIASPHEYHADQAGLAAAAGKHILVDKPIAIELDDARRMVSAAADAGVHLIVGPSHSFDAPVLAAHRLVEEGAIGPVRQIQALNYTDFLYRPRRPEELDTAQGGGVVFNQAVHQIDVARLLGGGLVRQVTARTGNWDPARPTEGAYTALLDFETGAFASLTYNGYARYDSDELMDWVGELGQRKSPKAYGKARRALAGAGSPDGEIALKAARKYGPGSVEAAHAAAMPAAHEHFGFVVVSGDRGDLRLRANGVEVYGDDRRLVSCQTPAIPRKEVVDELHAAVVDNVPPLHSGAWGLATLEVALAILSSAATGGPETMHHQTPVRGRRGNPIDD